MAVSFFCGSPSRLLRIYEVIMIRDTFFLQGLSDYEDKGIACACLSRIEPSWGSPQLVSHRVKSGRITILFWDHSDTDPQIDYF